MLVLPGRFYLRLRHGGALLGQGRSTSIRAGRQAVRLRLTRAGIRRLARLAPPSEARDRVP